MASTAGLAAQLKRDWELVKADFKARKWAVLLAMAGAALPLAAQANSASAEYFASRASNSSVPVLLSQDDRAYYRDLFAAIEGGNWAKVQAMFAQRPDGPLHQVAKAEYYTAAGSPKIDTDTLSNWLNNGLQLPEAEQIRTMAQKRGATVLPDLPQARSLTSLPSRAKRIRPRETNDGTMPAAVAGAINSQIKNDSPASAKALLDGIDSQLSMGARAEWRSKIAWSFYIENDDASAYALAQTAQAGSGPWVAEGWWIAGLSA
ncbi:MAG: hypothetical protein ACKOOL_01555 [Novosphingobium sp.]